VLAALGAGWEPSVNVFYGITLALTRPTDVDAFKAVRCDALDAPVSNVTESITKETSNDDEIDF